MLVNVGTRIEAVLTDPLVTGAAFAPATARLEKDVYVDDRLAVPAGSLLVGEGFATLQDDRAQILFTSIVKDGQTIRFEGWALQQGEMGVRAKVIRKGSKVKKGAGTVLGAAASALTFGLRRGLGTGRRRPRQPRSDGRQRPRRRGRDWRRSDKVVRVRPVFPSRSTSAAT
jgi:hypothetical protein